MGKRKQKPNDENMDPKIRKMQKDDDGGQEQVKNKKPKKDAPKIDKSNINKNKPGKQHPETEVPKAVKLNIKKNKPEKNEPVKEDATTVKSKIKKDKPEKNEPVKEDATTVKSKIKKNKPEKNEPVKEDATTVKSKIKKNKQEKNEPVEKDATTVQSNIEKNKPKKNEPVKEDATTVKPKIKKNKQEKKEPIEEDATTVKSNIEENKPENNEPVVDVPKLDISKIDKNVFPLVRNLKDELELDKEKHLQMIVKLMNSKDHDTETNTITCTYVLSRLVRCLGANDRNLVAEHAGYMYTIISQVENLKPIELINCAKHVLPVSGGSKGLDDNLAAVGQVIVALAILRSAHFMCATKELLEAVYQILTAYLDGREYLIRLSADIIIHSFTNVEKKKFKEIVWPIMKPMIKPLKEMKAWQAHLGVAINCLYPKLLPRNDLEHILWGNDEPQIVKFIDLYMGKRLVQNSLYLNLAIYICGDSLWLQTWIKHVTTLLPVKSTMLKLGIIRLFSFLTSSGDPKVVATLYSAEPLVKFVVDELNANKQVMAKCGGRDELKPVELNIQNTLLCFNTCLSEYFEMYKKNECLLIILKQLIKMEPNLERIFKTPTAVKLLLGHLNAKDLGAIFNIYMEKLVGITEDVPKVVRESYVKRIESIILSNRMTETDSKPALAFLLNTSIFNMNGEKKMCTASKQALFSRALYSRCEDIVYGSLLQKIGNLKIFVNELRTIILSLDESLEEQEIVDFKRAKWTEKIRDVWRTMMTVIQSPPKYNRKNEELFNIFSALIMMLGLNLHSSNRATSSDSIYDLIECMKRALQATTGEAMDEEDNMPWQDVLIEILLSIQVANGHYWRDFVNAILKELTPYLNISNLLQLLSILDLTQNPLAKMSNGGDAEMSSDDEEGGMDEYEEVNTDSDEDFSDDDVMDEESDDDSMVGGENPEDNKDDGLTKLEQVRENVRKALMATDELVGVDNDDDSIDWNDVDEDSGERINNALASAFKAFKPKSGEKSQQETKVQRTHKTYLLHFRMRAVQMLKILLNGLPSSHIYTEAITSLYEMYVPCRNDKSHTLLADAIHNVIKDLLKIEMEFKPDVSERHLIDALNRFKQIKPSTSNKGETDERSINLLNACISHLFGILKCYQPLSNDSKMWDVINGYVDNWVHNRRVCYSLECFDKLFNSNWPGRLKLALLYSSYLSSKELRSLRRVQLMKQLIKNATRISSLISENEEQTQILLTNLNRCKGESLKLQELAMQLMRKLNVSDPQHEDGLKKEMKLKKGKEKQMKKDKMKQMKKDVNKEEDTITDEMKQEEAANDKKKKKKNKGKNAKKGMDNT